MKLAVHRSGEGPRVVLVHGAILGGRHTWFHQRPLAERWTLEAVDRLGHADSPPGPRDFEVESGLLAEQLLEEPAHLVGHSYGAIICAFAAAARPEAVRSLVMVEPPAFHLGRGHEDVEWRATELRALIEGDEDDPGRILGRFFAAAGVQVPLADPLPAPLADGARALVGARSPDEAELPLDQLATLAVPLAVVSGGHAEAFELICDVIADRTGARRESLPGAAHMVQDTGAPFNALLEDVWRSAEGAPPYSG